MTPILATAILFLIIALVQFAHITMQFTSMYFDIDKVRKEIKCAMATWGLAMAALVVYTIT